MVDEKKPTIRDHAVTLFERLVCPFLADFRFTLSPVRVAPTKEL